MTAPGPTIRRRLGWAGYGLLCVAAAGGPRLLSPNGQRLAFWVALAAGSWLAGQLAVDLAAEALAWLLAPTGGQGPGEELGARHRPDPRPEDDLA
jgi:hypothetical protein